MVPAVISSGTPHPAVDWCSDRRAGDVGIQAALHSPERHDDAPGQKLAHYAEKRCATRRCPDLPMADMVVPIRVYLSGKCRA